MPELESLESLAYRIRDGFRKSDGYDKADALEEMRSWLHRAAQTIRPNHSDPLGFTAGMNHAADMIEKWAKP